MTSTRWCSRSKRCARKARSSARYRPLSPDREEVVNRFCLRVLAAMAFASLPASAALSAELTAQDYPARPVRLIVSFPAGRSDVLGRAFAQHATLGQPVVVENVPGANGAIGLTRLAKSAPDGHTVALGATTNLAVSPHLNSKLPYDPLKDFAPIALLARVPIVLVVNAAVPARSVAELVALARAHPGELNYGSIGTGSTGHLLGEMLRRRAGIDIVHVPYKGAAPGVTALLAGEVQFLFFPVFVDARALVRSGALRPLALVDSRRSVVAPDLPTLPELGYPLEAAAWFALIAPAGPPEAIVQRFARSRLQRGNGFQRAVVKHHERRHAVLAGDAQTPGAQRPEQRRVGSSRADGLPADGPLAAPGAGRPGGLLAQHHARLAFQHLARGLRELQRAERFAVRPQMAERDQLPEHRAPLSFVEVAADAESGKPVMAELRYPPVRPAEQHVDHVPRAEALAGAIDAGQRLLRGHRAVPYPRRIQTVVAVTARPARLAEVGEQPDAATAGGLGQSNQRIELAHRRALEGVVGRGFVDHAPLLHDVGEAVAHPRLGRFAVASGAAGFLVVGLDRFRKIEMRHEARVRLVDAHAECDRRHHHHRVLVDEAVLVRRARAGLHAGVVGERVDAVSGEPGRGLLRLRPRQAIDDARFARVPRADEIEQLRARVLLFDDLVADVRPVETGDENARVVELQARDDFAPRGLVGGRGERDARNRRMALGEQRELDVLRPEIVPPLRNAVRLVDGEEREPRALEQTQEARRHQPLRRDVEQVEPAREQLALDLRRRLRVERRIEAGRFHARFAQRRHLVVHQRDQGRDDDAAALAHQRRDLKAQRLAAAGGHQHQRIAAVRDVLDDLALLAEKRREAEDRFENRESLGHAFYQ